MRPLSSSLFLSGVPAGRRGLPLHALPALAHSRTRALTHSRTHAIASFTRRQTEKERSPIDIPQEWITPEPSRRPDIFPEFERLETPLPKPLPGDPEVPDEEEEEEEEKKKKGPGEDPDEEGEEGEGDQDKPAPSEE